MQYTVEVPVMLSVKKASKLFEGAPGTKTIYDAIAVGELKCYRPNGRDFLIKASDFVEWIEKHPYRTRIDPKELRAAAKNGIA